MVDLAAVAKLAEVARVHPLLVFKPSPALAPFCEDTTNPLQLVRAANRVGKTRHAAYKAAKFAVENAESRGRCVSPTRAQMSAVMGRYLAEFLAPHLATGCYFTPGKGWNINTIRTKNGSLIQLKSYEDHVTSHAGDELDFVCLDEPPPAAILLESIARLVSRNGQLWLCATMVGRPIEYLQRAVETPGSRWVQYLARFSRENCPWYSDEQVNQWLETMESAPWEHSQRVEGAWTGATLDRFYTGFSERNVDPAAIQAGASVELALAIDHGHTGGNTVALLMLVSGDASRPASWLPQAGRHVWVVDEHVSEDGHSEVETSAGIIDMLRRRGFKPTDVKIAVGDWNYSGNWRINDILTREIARQVRASSPPFRIVNATKDRGWGHRTINSALSRRELFIDPRCKALLKSLRHWRGSSKGVDGDLSHAADAMRYGVLAILGERPYYAGLRF